jgi:hypothetical protein
MNDEAAFSPIIVSEHAAWRARQRFGVTEPSEIRVDVREALLADRVCEETKPRWLSGDFKLRPGDAIVWTSARDRIYLVKLRSHRVVVVTAVDKCKPGR